jgi:hypothetical protein
MDVNRILRVFSDLKFDVGKMQEMAVLQGFLLVSAVVVPHFNKNKDLVIREVFRGCIDQVGQPLISGTIWNRTENGTESDRCCSPSTEAAELSRDRTNCKELQIAASKPCKLHQRFSSNS